MCVLCMLHTHSELLPVGLTSHQMTKEILEIAWACVVSERGLVAMRAPLQRGQVAWMSDHENVRSILDQINIGIHDELEFLGLKRLIN